MELVLNRAITQHLHAYVSELTLNKLKMEMPFVIVCHCVLGTMLEHDFP